jgi:hypothetical protein
VEYGRAGEQTNISMSAVRLGDKEIKFRDGEESGCKLYIPSHNPSYGRPASVHSKRNTEDSEDEGLFGRVLDLIILCACVKYVVWMGWWMEQKGGGEAHLGV